MLTSNSDMLFMPEQEDVFSLTSIQTGEDKSHISARFSAASESYQQHARLQRIVADQLMSLTRSYFQLNALATPQVTVDLGCGTGYQLPKLAEMSQQLVACDLSADMLAQAAKSVPAVTVLQGDAEKLPLANNSIDLLHSSLMIQWCDDITRPLNEISRVLKPGGVAVISTILDGSLREMAEAFSVADQQAGKTFPQQHINSFMTFEAFCLASQMPGLNVALCRQAQVKLAYRDIKHGARELKGIGASHVKGRTKQGLTGKSWWHAAQAHFSNNQNATTAGIPISWNIGYLIIEKQ